jgi:hypothetical protein
MPGPIYFASADAEQPKTKEPDQNDCALISHYQQRNFGIFVIILIGEIAIGIAFLILLWNKRLKSMVNSKTEELSTYK